MARRRRRSRGLRDYVTIPGLGVLNKSVNTTDVLIGGLFGFAGTLLLKGLGNKLLAGKVPDVVLKGSPLVGGAITGAASYFALKRNRPKANAYLFGSLAAGAFVQLWDLAKTSFPEGLGDVVSLKFNRYGVLVDDPMKRTYGQMGVLVDDPMKQFYSGAPSYGSQSDSNLAELAAMSADDPEMLSDLEQLMQIG